MTTTLKETTKLIFRCYHSKKVFVKQNILHDDEILAQTDGTITLRKELNGPDWEQSCYVAKVVVGEPASY